MVGSGRSGNGELARGAAQPACNKFHLHKDDESRSLEGLIYESY